MKLESENDSLFRVINDLYALLDVVDSFLLNYLPRVDLALSTNGGAVSDSGEENCECCRSGCESDEYDSEPDLKEKQSQIAEQLRLLERAWIDLENEQKRFLRMKQPQRNASPIEATESTPTRSLSNVSALNAKVSSTIPSADAVSDFRKLKQEILSAKLYSSNGGRR